MSNVVNSVVWTMADHLSGVSGEFLTLGGIDFESAADARQFWNALPEDKSATPDTDDFTLIADFVDAVTSDNLEDKHVSRETVEQYLTEPFDDAVAKAREFNRDLEEQLSKRFASNN